MTMPRRPSPRPSWRPPRRSSCRSRRTSGPQRRRVDFRWQLKVRALLAVFADPPVSLHDEPPVMIVPEGEKETAGAA